MNVVEAEGFGLWLGDRPLLAGIDLSLEAGVSHALIGERAAGKTVLLRALMGLWPDAARVTGRLVVDGLELSRLGPDERRRARTGRLFYLPPSGRDSLNPIERVEQQITDIVLASPGRRRDRRQEVAELRARASRTLRELGIGDPERVLLALPDELSGGMAKRVLLAMALLLQPTVLAADDPTAGLDVTIQRQILELLDEIQRNEGFTMVLATQDLGVVAHYAATVTVLQTGRVAEQTVPRAFFSGPASETGRAMLERARMTVR